MHKESSIVFARWGDAECAANEVCFAHDGETLPSSLQHCNVVLGIGTETRASELLERGAKSVLLADAAMLDCQAVSRLSQQYGTARVGVSLRARNRHISWSLDTVSNADFRCLTPSVGKTGWEIVMSDGTGTGTDAEWWLGEMMKLGASMALIRADMQDDDLNLCAGLVEVHGNKLWFSPWQHPDADLEPWVRYGQIRQLLLPTPNTRDENEMERIRAAAQIEPEAVTTESDTAENGEEATA